MVRATAALVLGIFGASLAAADTGYPEIAGRNVFCLKPRPIVLEPAVRPPLRKPSLIGFATILPRKQAVLLVTPALAPVAPSAPADSAKQRSYLLAEGQREDGIAILQIDEKQRAVTVEIDGTVETLRFDCEMKTARR